MKQTATLATLAMALLAATPAWSSDLSRTNAGDNWPRHLDAPSGMAAQPAASPADRLAALYGSPAPATTATRTITLAPGLKHVNVAAGETVAFRSGGETRAWTFVESLHGISLDLGAIFPGLANAQGVRAYVDRSRIFTGG